MITAPEMRLGRNSSEEVKAHPFFSGVEWSTIRNIEPPFVPHLKSSVDTQYFPVDDLNDVPQDHQMDARDTQGGGGTKEWVHLPAFGRIAYADPLDHFALLVLRSWATPSGDTSLQTTSRCLEVARRESIEQGRSCEIIVICASSLLSICIGGESASTIAWIVKRPHCILVHICYLRLSSSVCTVFQHENGKYRYRVALCAVEITCCPYVISVFPGRLPSPYSLPVYCPEPCRTITIQVSRLSPPSSLPRPTPSPPTSQTTAAPPRHPRQSRHRTTSRYGCRYSHRYSLQTVSGEICSGTLLSRVLLTQHCTAVH